MKKYLFFFCVIGVMVLFISSNLGDKIINEPIWLSLGIFLLSAFIIYPLVKKFFYQEATIVNAETNTNKLFLVIIWISLTAAATFIILAPVRYAFILASKSNPEEVKVCEIKSFFKKSKNKKKHLFYYFDGHANKKKLNRADYQKLLEGRGTKNYKLYLTLKKSILNTWVIQRYEIKE